MGISGETYMAENLLAVYKGLVGEQFAGQQLLALNKPFEEPGLYYWQREARGSSAEVDYIWQKGEYILPIEIKSGKFTVNDVVANLASIIIVYDVNADIFEKLNHLSAPVPRIVLITKQTSEEARFFHLKNLGNGIN